MKNRLLAGAMALALVGCSQKADEQSAGAEAAASESVAESGGPDIAPSAAPGVAFDYAYHFRIEDDRIAKVQEGHAAACEALGIARCRIAGMEYRLVRDHEVEARLKLLLDPAIARRFGRDAIASVEKAEGVLAEVHIDGTDVGTALASSRQDSADTRAAIARLEARLGQRGLGDAERSELRRQIAELTQQLGAQRSEQRAGEAQLASTPMTFDYEGTGGLPGIGYGNPFASAWRTLMESGSTMLWFILVAGAAVLPWALLAWGSATLWRRLRPPAKTQAASGTG